MRRQVFSHFFFSSLQKANVGCLASRILLKVSFTVPFPAWSLKFNSQEMCLRNFDPLRHFTNTCSDVTRIPNIHIYFYIITQQMGEQTPILFNPTQFLLNSYLATYLTKPMPKMQYTSLSHCVQCALFLSPQNAAPCTKGTRQGSCYLRYKCWLMTLSYNFRNLLLAKKLFWSLSLVHFSSF